ncbi:hypothetical protein C1Y40_04771 [Mycobacterium talmoniae]|uniref:Uncharacterized protein n=1 Tax=Mycobacterium talmoniae TaxID=1858794 RepID=A0A2S8BEL2_9MYCO|nr:hypothetical protein C1Y40_04771 [Mycobacterium talmoniae]
MRHTSISAMEHGKTGRHICDMSTRPDFVANYVR